MNSSITKLMRYLLLVGVIIFLALVIFPLIAGRQGALSSLKLQEKQTTLTISRALVHAYWPEFEHLLVDADALEVDRLGLEQALEELLEGSIVKINLFNREGVTVHSTDASVIGEKEGDNANLEAALKGEISQEFERYTLAGENRFQEIQVLSVYLPLRYHIDPDLDHDTKDHHAADHHDSDEVIGVLEIYSNVTPQLQNINRAQVGIALSTTLLLLLIYGSAFFFLRRATKTVSAHQDELERYALIVKQTPTVFIATNKQGQVLFLNPSAKKHFPDLVAFESAAILPATRHPLLAAWDGVTDHLQPGTTFEREVMVADKIYLQKIAYNAQSHTYDIYAYDLTQLKRSEEGLRKAQREQRALLDALPDMMFVADKDGVLLECKIDEKHQDIGQLLGRNFKDLGIVPADIANLFDEAGREALEKQQPRELEYDLVNETGQRVFYEARVIPLGAERVMSLVRDVSGRKQQDFALQESEAQVRSLLEAIPDMVFVMSRDGTYLDIKLDKTHGLIEELVGRNVRELGFISPEIAEGITEKLQRASSTGHIQTLEYSLEGNINHQRRMAHYEARFAAIDRDKVLMLVRDVSKRHDDEVSLQALTGEAQRRARELLLLDKVRSVATQELELKHVISKTVKVIAETFDYTLVSIYLLENQDLVLQHQVGYKEFIERLPLSKGVMGKVARTGQSILLKHPKDDPSVIWAFEGINSEICVPLLDTGRVVGVLNVESTEKRFFDEADLQLMTALSETLGVSIERARLYSETRLKEAEYRELYSHSKGQALELARRNDELALLDNVRSALVSQLELKDFYGAITQAVTKHLGYPCAFIYEIEGDTFKLAHQIGYATSLLTMPISQGVCGRVLRTGAAILVPDVSQDPDHVIVQDTILSGIYVPFYYNGVVKGVLSVETLREQNVELTQHDLGLLSSLSDMITLGITRVQLYSELKTNEERYRELIENASDIIYRIDLKGNFIYTNSVVKRLLGYDETEVIGRNYLELVQEDYRKEMQAFYIQQLKENLPTTYLEFPALNVHGQEVWLGQNVSLVFEGGRMTGMQAVARDVTERKRMEEALLQQAEALSTANADLEQFAFIAAHDLQEPLRKIQAFGDRLHFKYKNVLDEQGRDYLERMRGSATRMRTLIDDLLSFARANKQQQRSLVSLETIVRGVLGDLQVRIEETQATISVGTLPTLEVDPSQIRQVFQNLLSNALKFRKPDVTPVITVYSHRLGTGDWAIRVSDNGIGFEEQYKERIFAVFQRLHSREQYEGTGIGLAIVRRIIEGHDGSTEVSSRLGEGTTFTVTLPGVAKIATEDSPETVLA